MLPKKNNFSSKMLLVSLKLVIYDSQYSLNIFIPPRLNKSATYVIFNLLFFFLNYIFQSFTIITIFIFLFNNILNIMPSSFVKITEFYNSVFKTVHVDLLTIWNLHKRSAHT